MEDLKELGPNDGIIFSFMSLMVKNLKLSKEEVLKIATENEKDKHKRYRAKKKATYIFEKYIEGQDYQKEAESMSNFFNELGWK